MNKLEAFWDWVDTRGVIRRIVLAVAVYMTWAVSEWAMRFVAGCPRSGVDIAAIITAVTAPVTVFGGYVFKAYIESRAG